MKHPLDASKYRMDSRPYKVSKAFENISDNDSKRALIYTWEKTTNGYDDINAVKAKYFIAFLSLENHIAAMPLSAIEWTDICSEIQYEPTFASVYHHFIYYILKNNLYFGAHKDKLLTLIEAFKNDPSYHSKTLRLYCGDDIERLFYNPSAHNLKWLQLPKECNRLTLDLLSKFWSKTSYSKNDFREFYNLFPFSINQSMVININDYSYETWKAQTNYYKEYSNNPKHCLEMLNRYYLFVNSIVEEKDHQGIFKQNDPIDKIMLSRDNCAKNTLEGYSYIYFNPYMHYPVVDKWMLNFNGYEKKSTKFNANNIRSFNFEKIINPFYRDCAKDYVWNSGYSPAKMEDSIYQLIYVLNFAFKMKSTDEYPNPSLTEFTFYEADQIRSYLDRTKKAANTKNQYLSSFRSFCRYCVQNRNFIVDDYFYKHLSEFSRTTENKATAIPDDDLIKLNNMLKEQQYNSEVKTFYYAIFHICLQTSLRISQICHLRYDCLSNTMKDGQYKIKTVSKTSNGEEYKTIISRETGKQIKDIIKITEDNRQNCKDSELASYLFLKKDQMLSLGYTPVNASNFKDYLYECCEKLHIPQYGPSNLRDTHITKAFEFRLRNGMSDAAEMILTGHTNIDIDNNHYIQKNLIQMLESTYGIIIGDVNIKGQIVSNDSDSINQENSVENGCGYCKARSCVFETSLPCLYCKYFITTTKHKKYFVEMMKHVDDVLKSVDDNVSADKRQHTKDDLVAIKELIAAYLYHIDLVKEGIESECNNK